MATRIRYEESGRENMLRSKQTFALHCGETRQGLRVYLDTQPRMNSKQVEEVKFFIRDEITQDFVCEGVVSVKKNVKAALGILKKRVKKTLEDLGVVFRTELRHGRTNAK